MLKGDLVKKVKEALSLSSDKAANEALDKFVNVLIEAAKAGEEVTLNGFGKFTQITKPARKCRNPKTGETIDVPEKKVVKFKLANTLKNGMNE